MGKSDYAGIDYGRGMANVDGSTGIRYGVIHHGEVGQAWYDESEANYHDPECPKCGGEVVDLSELGDERELRDEDDRLISSEEIDEWECAKYECSDYACINCRYVFGPESAIPEEPYSHSYDKDGYACEQGYDDPDIFILKSPYYTWCQFCSPCAPGAGYITNHMEPGMGIKAYVFGHDWFEEVETGKSIQCKYCDGVGRRTYPNDLTYTIKPCHVCAGIGEVKEMVSKAPYPVYRVGDDSLVEVTPE